MERRVLVRRGSIVLAGLTGCVSGPSSPAETMTETRSSDSDMYSCESLPSDHLSITLRNLTDAEVTVALSVSESESDPVVDQEVTLATDESDGNVDSIPLDIADPQTYQFVASTDHRSASTALSIRDSCDSIEVVILPDAIKIEKYGRE